MATGLGLGLLHAVLKPILVFNFINVYTKFMNIYETFTSNMAAGNETRMVLVSGMMTAL